MLKLEEFEKVLGPHFDAKAFDCYWAVLKGLITQYAPFISKLQSKLRTMSVRESNAEGYFNIRRPASQAGW